jgi:hypothetical protein
MKSFAYQKACFKTGNRIQNKKTYKLYKKFQSAETPTTRTPHRFDIVECLDFVPAEDKVLAARMTSSKRYGAVRKIFSDF